MKRLVGGLAAIGIGLGLVGAAARSLAQPPAAAPVSAVTASMRQMGGARGGVGGGPRGGGARAGPPPPGPPPANTAGAARLDTLAGQLPGWFAAPVTGAPTRSKPEVWSDAKGFAAAAQALKAQTARLASLSDAGDVAALRAQAPSVGAACKACHDVYRAPEQK